jgi:hypothetical protein
MGHDDGCGVALQRGDDHGFCRTHAGCIGGVVRNRESFEVIFVEG